MRFSLADTIVAIASAPGSGLSGIVRVSGPQAISCVARCCPEQAENIGQLSRATALSSRFHRSGESPSLHPLPVTLYVWPGKQSYTREASVEIHAPGSPPLLNQIVAALCQSGCRLAEPGEFTLRAFLAGRMDLTQAEAVLGVIDARGEQELATSLSQLAGGLAHPLAQIRGDLLDLLADIEAGLDFVDEDIQFISSQQIATRLSSALDQTRQLSAQTQSRTDATSLPRIVLVGAPNAGKSSLLNALAGESVALVSPVAGTTRDYVERRTSFCGVECLLVDTAGVAERDSENDAGLSHEIDVTAMEQSRRQREQAAVVVHCVDLSAPLTIQDFAATEPTRETFVATKADLPGIATTRSWLSEMKAISVSACTGEGVADLARTIGEKVLERDAEASNVVPATAVRCRESLRAAEASLQAALDTVQSQQGDELVAGEIRLALDELGRVAGTVGVDDLLDRVFSRFCIGK
jgi:tRNA modification GTPase